MLRARPRDRGSRSTRPAQAISDVRFGHALALSPDGTRLASVGGTGITVTDLDGTVVASTDLSASPVYRQPESVMWLDDDTLAVVELRQPDTGNEFRLFTVDAALTGATGAEGSLIGTDLEATWPRLGGVADDGSLLVFRGARGGTVADRLEAYDPVTLAARPASDIVAPGRAGRRRLVRRHADLGRLRRRAAPRRHRGPRRVRLGPPGLTVQPGGTVHVTISSRSYPATTSAPAGDTPTSTATWSPGSVRPTTGNGSHVTPSALRHTAASPAANPVERVPTP